MSADREPFLSRLLARLRPGTHTGPAAPPSLPLLTYVGEPQPGDWLRTSMTTFSRTVASFLPGHFEAYARVYHPFEFHDGTDRPGASWREQSAAAGVDMYDPVVAGRLAWQGVGGEQARIGELPPALIEPLVEHLRRATGTPERCFFAVWEGFAGSAVPFTLMPTLELPHRGYHVFSGPVDGAHTSFSVISFDHQSANLWWPADHAWCVATEVDFAWTYIGGTRSCIAALLADPRLEAVETAASSPW